MKKLFPTHISFDIHNISSRIPLHDFFRNPERAAYQISPDGEYLSFMQPFESRMNVYVQKIGSDKTIRITSETERDVAGYFWKGNHRILYLKDFKGDENFGLVAVDKDGTNQINLTVIENVKTEIIDELEDHETDIIIGLNKRDAQILDAYRLNTLTGEINLVAENPGNITGWVTDHEGKIRIAITTDGVNTSLLYRESEQDEFGIVLTTNFKESVSPLFFTFDNRCIYASSNLGRDKNAIVKFDVTNGKEMEVLFEHPEVDVSGLSYSKKRKVLTSISYLTWKREIKFLDEEIERMYNRLSNNLNGYEITIADHNKNEDKFLIRTFSDRSLGAYYLYDVLSDTHIKLNDISPWL